MRSATWPNSSTSDADTPCVQGDLLPGRNTHSRVADDVTGPNAKCDITIAWRFWITNAANTRKLFLDTQGSHVASHTTDCREQVWRLILLGSHPIAQVRTILWKRWCLKNAKVTFTESRSAAPVDGRKYDGPGFEFSVVRQP